MDSYKYVVITFMGPKSNPSKIIKLIKNQNLIMSIIGEYVLLGIPDYFVIPKLLHSLALNHNFSTLSFFKNYSSRNNDNKKLFR